MPAHPSLTPALASPSPSAVTVNEVEALHELFKRVSNSLFVDGLIHREEFCLALFKNAKAENLFANRVRVGRRPGRGCAAQRSRRLRGGPPRRSPAPPDPRVTPLLTRLAPPPPGV